MKPKRLVLLAVGLLTSPIGASANIVYGVNENFDGGTITGTFTTDGTLGEITTATPFLNWNLTFSYGPDSGNLTPANSFLFNAVYPSFSFRFIATADTLTFDHAYGQFFLIYGFTNVTGWCLEGPLDGCANRPGTSNWGIWTSSGPNVRVNSGPVSESVFHAFRVPEPSSLALLGLGLAGLGLSRRRKM